MPLRILLLIVLGLPFAARVAGQTVKPKPLPEISATARFRSLEGTTPISLNEFRDKVVVVVLWASWCAPCRMLFYEFRNFNKEFDKQPVELVALTVEKPEQAAADVKRFVANSGLAYRVGWISEISAQKLMAGEDVVPQLFVIKDGVILRRFLGWKPESTPSQIRQALREVMSNE